MAGAKLLTVEDVDPEVIKLVRLIHKDLSRAFYAEHWAISEWEATEIGATPLIHKAHDLGLINAKDSTTGIGDDAFDIWMTEKGCRLLGVPMPVPTWDRMKRRAWACIAVKIRRIKS